MREIWKTLLFHYNNFLLKVPLTKGNFKVTFNFVSLLKLTGKKVNFFQKYGNDGVMSITVPQLSRFF